MMVKFDEEGNAYFTHYSGQGDDNQDLQAKSKMRTKEHWTSIYKQLLRIDIGRAINLAEMMNLDYDYMVKLRHALKKRFAAASSAVRTPSQASSG